jgi:hypothetical protein
MTRETRSLLFSVAIFVAALAAVDAAYARYVRAHFIPERRFRDAVARGDGCVLTLGDSRMAAGVVPGSVERGLEERGVHECVATLALGAVDVQGAYLALRRYADAPRTPSLVVLGVGTTLPRATVDPSEMIGNGSVLLGWSRSSDVSALYPGFPFHELDRGLRFSIERTNALSSYASLAWIGVQAWQGRVAGEKPGGARNEFGLLADMGKLGDGFMVSDRDLQREWDGHFRNDAWFERIRASAHALGAKLAVVLVPMRKLYRDGVASTPEGRRYLAWLEADLARSGDVLLDMRDLAADEDFGDGLHMSGPVRDTFSVALGREVAASVRR